MCFWCVLKTSYEPIYLNTFLLQMSRQTIYILLYICHVMSSHDVPLAFWLCHVSLYFRCSAAHWISVSAWARTSERTNYIALYNGCVTVCSLSACNSDTPGELRVERRLVGCLLLLKGKEICMKAASCFSATIFRKYRNKLQNGVSISQSR